MQRDTRLAWFREAKFGLFIHWGVYAVPAGTYNGKQIPGIGEWIMNRGKIPMAEYQAYAKRFNPVKSPGTFNVTAQVAADKDSQIKISLAGKSLSVPVPACGSDKTFKPLDLGRFTLDETGEYTLHVTPARRGWQPVNWRSVKLTPQGN